MGSLFSGSQKQTTKSEPWAPQGAALKDIFAQAGQIYNSQSGTPFYQGPLYAGLDDTTKNALAAASGFASGTGADNANTISDAARKALSSWSDNPNAIDELMMRATEDPTSVNIRNATEYANNPAIQGQIDAASRDVARNLNENEVPTINRVASGSGNINSTRAGVAEAVARRGAADRVADISSQIRGDAFDRGLSLSEQARQANMGQLGNVAQLGNQQYSLGIDGLLASNNLNLSNIDSAIKAGQIGQQDRQGQVEADFARWQGQDTRASDLLGRYYGIIGANNWGGTQTTKTSSRPSIFGSALGLGSLASGFGLFGGGKGG